MTLSISTPILKKSLAKGTRSLGRWKKINKAESSQLKQNKPFAFIKFGAIHHNIKMMTPRYRSAMQVIITFFLKKMIQEGEQKMSLSG